MERFGVISDEKLTEEIWADGGHYYLRQEWNNGWLSETGVNYNWVNPNEDKLDDKVFLTNVEELEKRRTEALARMPKRVEVECGVVESRIGLTEDFHFTISEESQKKIYETMNIDFGLYKFKVKVIIEEVQ